MASNRNDGTITLAQAQAIARPPATCRYCSEPRPDWYVTCGRSECQEAAYRDAEKRRVR